MRLAAALGISQAGFIFQTRADYADAHADAVGWRQLWGQVVIAAEWRIRPAHRCSGEGQLVNKFSASEALPAVSYLDLCGEKWVEMGRCGGLGGSSPR